jgi:hypothetical protein
MSKNTKSTKTTKTTKTTKATKNTKAGNTTEPKSDPKDETKGTKPDKAKRPNVYRRVQTMATVPGVGEIPITLVEVEFGGETKRANTRKECAAWLKIKRRQAADQAKEERQAAREQRDLERYGRMAPAVTDRLLGFTRKIEKLADNSTVTEQDRELIVKATAILISVANDRAARDKADGEEEAA